MIMSLKVIPYAPLGVLLALATLSAIAERSFPSPEPYVNHPSTATTGSDPESDDDQGHGHNGSQKIPLYIGGFFPISKESSWDGSGVLPAVDMALEHINERRDLLADYELRMEWADSEVWADTFLHIPTTTIPVIHVYYKCLSPISFLMAANSTANT